jgi:hypothetical protein
VIVRVEDDEPFAMIPEEGDAVRVEFARTGEPGTKTTVLVTELKPDGAARERVLVSALVEDRLIEVCPLVSVGSAG